jgi:hypothetical protein
VLVAMLVQGMNEHQAQIEALEATVAALEARR